MPFRKAFGQPRGALRPAPLPSLPSAFAARRAIFGPHELREDRIRAESYLAADLSPDVRRAIRDSADEVTA